MMLISKKGMRVKRIFPECNNDRVLITSVKYEN